MPAERRPEQSRLEVRYSPTLAGAMVDALPYLVDYPYGCTEQTLNRFLPTVITQKVLIDMRLDLKEIREKRTNLNAQEIGDDKERAEAVEALRAQPGLRRGRSREDGQGGRRAADRDAVLRRRLGLVLRLGRALLAAHHGRRRPRPANRPAERRGPGARRAGARRRVAQALSGPSRCSCSRTAIERDQAAARSTADNLDAFVYMVLVDAGVKNDDMREFLYRDRTKLAVYGKAMFGLALEKQGEKEKLAMILRNIGQYVVAGRREPDGLAQAARRGLLVVLVRQRDRGPRLLPEAAGADRSEGRAGPAAGQVPAQQPQARHLLELDARHGPLHRGVGRLPHGQRRGPAGHDRRGLLRRQDAEGGRDHAGRTSSRFDNKFVLEGEAVDDRASTRSSSTRRARARSTTTAT